ncbi:hypothetical protein Gorai_008658 [Gossypium raimondii]|uniref:LMBR1-like membrane protein n=1 Tax=Gossypium raimondii TaxID=29730 RepID=A0A7J8PRE1_GOSRA|nr:hypothetical protein [Gossypium raimondii]
MGMVILTLRYFAGPAVPIYVLLTVGYTWFCSFSIIILVPADIWTQSNIFILELDLLEYVSANMGYEDAGDFTMAERLKTSVHANLVFNLCVGSLGLVGTDPCFSSCLSAYNYSCRCYDHHHSGAKSGGILGFAMACSNTFGLVTGAFLLGFGLSEIPKGIWKNADWSTRQKVLSHKVAKMAVKLDGAHQEFSNAIVVTQATSSQMTKRDPLRPYMNIIDSMLEKMLKEDSSFKPQGGRFGENDMDYDTDEKSMASLRRRLRIARDQYCRYRSEYMSFVLEALELEDAIKNYERRDATGWKFVSSFRPVRTGKLGPYLDTTAAILLAEATILPRGVDLSLFSILINSVGRQELVGQITSFIPLMYMCVCTYYSLFKIGMLMFYALTPGQTSSVSLLMICSMVARYAPPISYNFLNLIDLPGKGKTVFEKRMGNIDDAVPFFGKGFNKIYPLIMVGYTLLLVTNFFDRVIKYFGNWKLFKLQIEVDGTDGFDTSGLIILQKERSWLEQGYKVGENIIPLARNFSSTSIDIEPGSNNTMVNKDKSASISRANSAAELEKMGEYKPLKEEVKQETSREALTKKYSGVREQPKNQESNSNSTDKESTSIAVDDGNSESARASLSGGLVLKWESMKSGLLSFKTNLEAKNFLPLRQTQESKAPSHVSSSESLDEIFQKLKRSSMDPKDHDDDDEF